MKEILKLELFLLILIFKIADYFHKENKEVQEIFKDLGLVILAPKEAVERGFVELSESCFEL